MCVNTKTININGFSYYFFYLMCDFSGLFKLFEISLFILLHIVGIFLIYDEYNSTFLHQTIRLSKNYKFYFNLCSFLSSFIYYISCYNLFNLERLLIHFSILKTSLSSVSHNLSTCIPLLFFCFSFPMPVSHSFIIYHYHTAFLEDYN